MRKRIRAIILLMAALAGTAGETCAQTNNDIMGKKNLGSLLALYPKPLTVVGTEVNGKVN